MCKIQYNIPEIDSYRLEIGAFGRLLEATSKTSSLEEEMDMTQERLKELFDYDKETGIFTHAVDRYKVKKGTTAEGNHNAGYKYICIDRKVYLSHRMAWLYTYGVLPNKIDHINHDRTDNRIINLRNVTDRDNQRNLSLRHDNKTGRIGVWFDRSRKKYSSRIRVDGKYIFLGRFVKKEDAIAARELAEKKYGFHENHGSTHKELVCQIK